MNFLAPIGGLYGKVMDLRNRLYDRGVLSSHSLEARTISIGNLTTGGTGKTPLVALTATILADGGEGVCILTRGYGRKNPKKRVLVSDSDNVLVGADEGGDEPVELARRLIGKAIVIADRDRRSAAEWAKGEFGITAFILDDGFQHRRVKRDLDIVCIDATNPCGNGRILPAGSLRESFRGLGRADVIVITRADLVGSTDDTESRLRKRNKKAPILKTSSRISAVRPVGSRGVVLDSIGELAAATGPGSPNEKVRLMAFCGLGNPAAFFGLLRYESTRSGSANFSVAAERKFPDHHIYSQREIEEMEAEARTAGVSALVTTGKDAVKLERSKFSIPVYAIEITPEISDPELFRSLVTSS